jgi:hypothetical protein
VSGMGRLGVLVVMGVMVVAGGGSCAPASRLGDQGNGDGANVRADAGQQDRGSDDEGSDDQRSDDAGSDDAGSDDQGSDDAGSDDEGSDDEGSDDQGSDDAGSDDAGSDDEGSDDAGSDDEGSDDEGSDDAGSDDQGSDDQGSDDAGSVDPAVPERAPCASGRVGLPENAGNLSDPELVETSGLASSWMNPGVLWAHNDSGDVARVFAVADNGTALGRFGVPGVDAEDIEDVGVALCPLSPASCIWLADTGDNGLVRAHGRLVVFAEPFVAADTASLDTFEVDDALFVSFTYETGPVDVEGVAPSADGTRVFLFEKVDGDTARVFALQAPFATDGSDVARVVATVPSPGLAVQHGRSITAASLHVSGTRLLVRVYTGIFEYRFPSDLTLDAAIASLGSIEPALLTLGPLSEPQGEAVTYDESGRDVWSVSEDPNQAPGQMLHRFRCRP